MSHKSLPDYEPMLAAYHSAFASELEAMVRTLEIVEGNLVLEMACGDGAYTPWLIELVGRSGRVLALDVSPEYLEVARESGRDRSKEAEADFVAASIERLPFAEKTFDAVWCAQSLFSLPEPVEALRRMASVVKPGGLVAVLEDDTLHQVLLPWPIELELAVRAAEWEALQAENRHPGKYYVGRKLGQVFREAGLVDLQARAFATSRIAPLDSKTREFLRAYLKNLNERVADRLEPKHRDEFDRLSQPGSADFLIDQDDFHLTMIDHVMQGRVPKPT